MSGVKLTEAERLQLAIRFGGCPFDENVNDASMCRCGLPALGHDSAVARIVAADNPEAFAAVERILADRLTAAWDEGYDMGDPYQRRGNPDEGKHRNPYRAALTTEADQ